MNIAYAPGGTSQIHAAIRIPWMMSASETTPSRIVLGRCLFFAVKMRQSLTRERLLGIKLIGCRSVAKGA